MKVVYSPSCLNYNYPSHPESPQRIERIYQSLKFLPSISFVAPQKATEQEILSVHDKTLLDVVKNGTFADPDTPVISGIYELALLAGGAAADAADLAQK